MSLKDDLLQLETGFWQAAGNGDFYHKHFADDGFVVFQEPAGVMNKEQTIETVNVAGRGPVSTSRTSVWSSLRTRAHHWSTAPPGSEQTRPNRQCSSRAFMPSEMVTGNSLYTARFLFQYISNFRNQQGSADSVISPMTANLMSFMVNLKRRITERRQSMSQETSIVRENIALIEQFNEAFNNQNIEATMAVMTANCVFENTSPAPDGTRHEGQAAVRAAFKEFFESSPGATFETEEIFAAQDHCVVRWTYRWGGSSSDAGHVRGVDVFHIQDDKIAAKLAYVKG